MKNSSNSSDETGLSLVTLKTKPAKKDFLGEFGKPEEKGKKQISPSLRWIFTLHNYTAENIRELNETYKNPDSSNSSKYIIFSEETGSEDETPHLQGYIEFSRKIRPVGKFNTNKISWRKAKCARDKNIIYIKKEGGTVYMNGRKMRKPKVLKYDQLYDWQKKFVAICDTEPNDRDLYWIWESKGCTGKTQLCKYIVEHYNAMVISGSAKDMKQGIRGWINETGFAPDILVINIPRSKSVEYVSYTGIEEIKDGLFFSQKYEGKMEHIPNPHIFVFANEKPLVDEMSKDRWKITHLKNL